MESEMQPQFCWVRGLRRPRSELQKQHFMGTVCSWEHSNYYSKLGESGMYLHPAIFVNSSFNCSGQQSAFLVGCFLSPHCFQETLHLNKIVIPALKNQGRSGLLFSSGWNKNIFLMHSHSLPVKFLILKFESWLIFPLSKGRRGEERVCLTL